MKPLGGTSWHGSRPDPDSSPTAHREIPALKFVPVRFIASSPVASTSTKPIEANEIVVLAHFYISKEAPYKVSPSSSVNPSPNPQPKPSGFKIRVPRDLPGVPAVFRNPESARSQSSASPRSNSSCVQSPAPSPTPRPTPLDAEPVYQQGLALAPKPIDTSKRTHGEMLSGETVPTKNYPIFDQQVNSGKKVKVAPVSAVSTTPTQPASKPAVPRVSRSMSRSNSSQSLSSGAPPSPKKSPTKRQPVKQSISSSPSQLPSQLPPVKIALAANSAGPEVQDVVVKQEDMDVTVTDMTMTDVTGTPASILRRHRSRSYSKSSSPASSPAPPLIRLPTPMSINGGTNGGSTESTSITSSLATSPKKVSSSPLPVQALINITSSYSHPTPQPVVDATSSSESGNASSTPPVSNSSGTSQPAQLQNNVSSDGSPNNVYVASSPPPPPASIANAIEENIRTNETLQLVRLGMSILDRLLSNPVSKSFVNKVPLVLTTYHAVIKRPMDLITVEQNLWKAFVMQQKSVSQPMNPALLSTADHITHTNGYSNQTEFEEDLWQIYKNAVHFNPPSDIIHKQAMSFQILYNGLLTAHRDGNLPIPRMPQELYHPSLVNLNEPGTLYLFRAQTFREMDRKLTDMAADLFAGFHQPLIDIMNAPEPISPERPRFARMYISKNRSLLSNCRDDPRARLAILSDLKISKPFSDIAGGPNPAKMVRITARVMIGKPIGERHDMITVGDLDCPSAWAVFAGIKTLDLDVAVPVRFEKRVLSRIRHDVTPFVDTKMTPEHEKSFLEALGVLIPTIQSDMSALSQSTGSVAQPPTLSATSSVQLPPISTQTPAPMPVQATPVTTTPDPVTERIEAEALPSLPSPTLTAAPAPTIFQPAATPIGSAIPLQRLGSQGVKRPFEETIPGELTGATDVQLVAKRRPSLVQSELSSTIPTSTHADHTATLSGPSTHPEQAVHQAPMPLIAPIESTPVALPTEISPSAILPAPVTGDQASQYKSTTVAPEIADLPSTTPLASTTPTHAFITEMTSTNLAPVATAPSSAGQEGKSGLNNMPPTNPGSVRELTQREEQMLRDIKVTAREKHVPYTNWSAIEPTLIANSAQGLFKRIYFVKGEDGLVVQNFKEMDTESFEQRVREVACLLKLRGLEGVGQIQSIIDDDEDHLVGLSMTKYAYTLKAYATNARRHPSPCQKLSLIRDMVAALASIHGAGLAHRDLSEVNIMPEEVKRWSMQDQVSEEELALLPLVVLPPDHGYKLYRSILTLPRSKHDHTPLPPCDPRAEDVYSLGVLMWRTFSGKSPWNGAIEDDIKTIRYLISSDEQIKFQLEREVTGPRSRELLLRCLTAETSTRSTIHELRDWLEQPEILADLLKEFEILGGGRKKVRKILD
ncbi:hypothetical protein BGZ95_010409 [Linnemannia exigua]|uniref:Protein kinase domain-containing protein n=1 Tax=Linnemannia exigua TaxID=604196 RepID=A0AAD4H5Z7_9FUNG|nr:hypothetical protein BGZ95_010409 [Linnemannia exigua]